MKRLGEALTNMPDNNMQVRMQVCVYEFQVSSEVNLAGVTYAWVCV